MAHPWATVAAACAGLAFLTVLAARAQSKSYPPGPPKLPLLGNLLNMPDGMDYKRFLELGKIYNSEIIHLSALGTSVVILNSYRVSRDLLDRRSAIYSSRPETVMMHELCHLKPYFVFSPYGDWWRACRRLFTRYLHPGETKLHRPQEAFYIQRFLGQLLDSPDRFRQHIRHLVGSISLTAIYGLEVQPENDPVLKSVEDAADALSTVILNGTYLVDIIPSLKHLPRWFPGAGFLKEADEMGRFNIQLRDTLFAEALTNLDKSREPSLVSECMQDIEQEKTEDQIEVLKYTAGQTYAAGADTTASAVASLFLAMVCHPNVQRRLQEELDAVLRDKLPTHEDIDSLPYLDAVMKEVLRWNPVTPIGVPHKVIADDIYEGHFIPKDSIVIANQWAMLHDPIFYPDPFSFRPERFLKDGKIDESVLDPTSIAFGFGRRICAGNHMAQSILKMTAASLIYTFNLEKPTDSDGNVIEPVVEYDPTFLSHPKDFACVLTPRSPEAKERVRLGSQGTKENW